MPVAPPHPCAGQCGALVPKGRSRCDACERKRNAARGTFRERGYDSRWERLRKLHLAKHPLCVVCEAEGAVTPAVQVDHIRPWQGGATEQEQLFLKYAAANLQSMCHSHHSRKTALQDGGFGHARRFGIGIASTGVARIVGVALRSPEGKVYALPAPYRHHDIITTVVAALRLERIGQGWEQGFVDSLGRWLRRTAALPIAQRAGQLLPRATCAGGQLFSEDVW